MTRIPDGQDAPCRRCGVQIVFRASRLMWEHLGWIGGGHTPEPAPYAEPTPYLTATKDCGHLTDYTDRPDARPRVGEEHGCWSSCDRVPFGGKARRVVAVHWTVERAR